MNFFLLFFVRYYVSKYEKIFLNFDKIFFEISIMKKSLDVAHGKLINIIGRPGNLDQYSWMLVTPLNDHLCSKSAQKR